MGKCKTCGTKYSFWSARGDGLCQNCGTKADDEADRQIVQKANERVQTLLEDIATGQEWQHYGLGLWTSLGHQASQTINLWIGRFIGGIMGDMLHSETMFMSLVGLTAKGDLYIVNLGETVGISPDSLPSSVPDRTAVIKAVISSVHVALNYEGKLKIDSLPNGKSFTMSFPSCFIAGNDKLPTQLEAAVERSQKNEPDRRRPYKSICPKCNQPYNHADYDPAVEHIYCSRCKEELPRT